MDKTNSKKKKFKGSPLKPKSYVPLTKTYFKGIQLSSPKKYRENMNEFQNKGTSLSFVMNQ